MDQGDPASPTDAAEAWQLATPTELRSKELNKCQQVAPWFRKAVRSAKDVASPDFRSQAVATGTQPFQKVHEAVEEGREKLHRSHVDAPLTVSELLSNSEQVGKLAPHYTNYRGQWRKCVVFRQDQDTEGSGKYPVWLLTEGHQGWEPDVRAGLLLLDRADIHTKDSRKMETSMRKAEIGEVTRAAITLGDVFPNIPSVERALMYFPQCFAPATEDAARRFAVREELPFEPLTQFGKHPSWAPGSFVVQKDVNATHKAQTPTGGPLVNAPSWPGPDTKCIECHKTVDAKVPGPTHNGVVLPCFIGRTSPADRTTHEFMHLKCQFANNERTLAQLEFVWHASKSHDASAFAFEQHKSMLTKKTNPVTVLPVTLKEGVMPSLTREADAEKWWVGDKGIIHVQVKEKHYEFLHFPSRKLVFLLAENGKPVSKGVPFEEGKRPYGHVLVTHYAKENSGDFHLLVKRVLEEQSTHDARLAAMEARDAAKKEEDAKAKVAAPTSAAMHESAGQVTTLLQSLSEDVVSLLDSHSFLLQNMDISRNTHTLKEVAAALDDEPGDEDSLSAMSEDDVDNQIREEKEKADEEDAQPGDDEDTMSETEAALLRPAAEDDGDEEEDASSEEQRDIEDTVTKRRPNPSIFSLRKSASDRGLFDVSPFLSLLRLMQTHAAHDDNLRGVLEDPESSLAQLNAYITLAAGEQAAGKLHGFEMLFPVLKKVERATEWAVLQQEYGAGLSESYYTQRFMQAPYHRLKGKARGICKALSAMTQEDHQRLLSLEALLLCRSVERRHHNTIATPLPLSGRTAEQPNEATLGAPLRKLYHEESLWLRADRSSGKDLDAGRVCAQVAAQLMVPQSRVVVAASGDSTGTCVVRVKGVQELQRLCAETPLQGDEGAADDSQGNVKLQVRQLLHLFHVGESITSSFGCFKGARGRWVGAVGPDVTLLNYILRGVHTPFKPTADRHIDTVLGGGGQWVYEHDGAQKPLEWLLGELPNLHAAPQGLLVCSRRRVEAYIALEEEEEEEEEEADEEFDEEDGTLPDSKVRVEYSFVEQHEFSRIHIDILSGTHEGESTTLPIFMRSPVQRLLWQADIRDDILVEAICAACQPSNSYGTDHPRVSELFWLLLAHTHDRDVAEDPDTNTGRYPWRFHLLFKRFGLMRRQAVRLAEIVDAEVYGRLGDAEREVKQHWRDMVRVRHFNAWVRLNDHFPAEVLQDLRAQRDEKLAEEEFRKEQDRAATHKTRCDIYDEDEVRQMDEEEAEKDAAEAALAALLPHQAKSEDDEPLGVLETRRLSTDLYVDEAECPSHGIDIHASSALNDVAWRIMSNDPVGRTALLRTLHLIRGGRGEQRYTWHGVSLVDSDMDESIPQGVAGRLAKKLRREVRRFSIDHNRADGQTGEPADSEVDSQSSDWDELSVGSDESHNPGDYDDRDANGKVDTTRARLDPFSAALSAQFDVGTKLRQPLPGSLMGCGRCSVTLQNIYRYADFFVEKFTHCAEPPLELAEVGQALRDGHLEHLEGFDSMISALTLWAQRRVTRGTDSLVTQEAKQEFLTAVEGLWECGGQVEPEEQDADSSDDEATDENDEEDENEDEADVAEREQQRRGFKAAQRCRSGLCLLWDLLAGMAEEVKTTDMYMRHCTAFGYSLVEALSVPSPIPVASRLHTAEAFLEKLAQFSPMPTRRSFAYEKSLYLITNQPVAELYFRFLHRNSMLAPRVQLISRYTRAWADQANSKALLSAAGVQADTLLPIAIEDRPYHRLGFEHSFGAPAGEAKAATFEEALCAARAKKVVLFVFDPKWQKVHFLKQEAKDVTYAKLPAGRVFCMLEDLRFYKSKWTTMRQVEHEILGDHAGAARWEAAVECRVDPCDNTHKTRDEFRTAHKELADNAWRDSEEVRLHTPEGEENQAYITKSKATAPASSVVWDELPECRRFPTNGYPSYSAYTEDDSQAPNNTPEGRFLPFDAFVQVLGKKQGDRKWAAMEPRRLGGEFGKAATRREFLQKSQKVILTIWQKLPDVPPTPEDKARREAKAQVKAPVKNDKELDHDDPDMQLFLRPPPAAGTTVGTKDAGLYLMQPTQDFLLNALQREAGEQETEEQFTAYANMRFPVIQRLRAEMQDLEEVVCFAPKLGDFTEKPYFVFALSEGRSLKEATALAEKIVREDADCADYAAQLSGSGGAAKRARTEAKTPALEKFFTVRPLAFEQAKDLEATKGLLRTVRYTADMSRNLQKLFKDRESSFPAEVFQLVRDLRYEHRAGAALSQELMQSCLEKLEAVGCSRVFISAVVLTGAKDVADAFKRASEGQMAVGTFLDAVTSVLVEDWTKPLQPSTLESAANVAASAGWLISTETYDTMHNLLAQDGATGVLDWAVRSMMYCHRPLSLELRTAATMVNVIKIVPVEVRRSMEAQRTSPPKGHQLEWEFAFFNESRKFETKTTAQLLEDMADDESLYEDMYVGHKIDDTRIRRRYLQKSCSVGIVNDLGSTGEPGGAEVPRHEMQPIIYITDKPVRITSYKVRALGKLQPVEWRMEGALVPYDTLRRILQRDTSTFAPGEVEGQCFSFMHRHTERWSRPIDENDFIPPTEHQKGRWMEADLVEHDADDFGMYSKAIVTKVHPETHQPTVYCNVSRETFQPAVGRIRHVFTHSPLRHTSDANVWFGAVGHVPGEWSQGLSIPDVVPLIFSGEQAPPIKEVEKDVLGWRDVSTYVNTNPEDGEVAVLKIEHDWKVFSLTRAGPGQDLEWEYGRWHDDNGLYNFTVAGVGIPGRQTRPSKTGFTASLPSELRGSEFRIGDKRLLRESPRRLHCLATAGQTHTIVEGWEHTGAYDLVFDEPKAHTVGSIVAQPQERRFHGQPVWRSTDEMAWLFADRQGRWVVAMTVGGPALLQSEENCVHLPGMCHFNRKSPEGGFEPCEGTFFVATNVKFESYHLHEQMKRLGIDRRRMNEMGFDADYEPDVRQHLHNQLAQRRAAETRAGDVWDSIRIAMSRVHKALDIFEVYGNSQATPASAALLQCLGTLSAQVVMRVRSLVEQDRLLERHEQDREEDDAIAEAALAIGRQQPHLKELASEWANKVRVADGSMYSTNRNEVLLNYFSRFEARRPGQVKDWRKEMEKPEFKHLAEACLLEQQTQLWAKKRFVTRFYNLVRKVLMENVEWDLARERNGQTIDDDTTMPPLPLTKRRRMLAAVEVLVRGAVQHLGEKAQGSEWAAHVRQRVQQPLHNMLVLLQEYSATLAQPDRKLRAAHVLRVTRNRNISPHDVLLNQVQAHWDRYTDALPYLPLYDDDEIDPTTAANWDEVHSATRLRHQQPLSFWHLAHAGLSRSTDIKWPFFFRPRDAVFGDNIINTRRLLQRRAQNLYVRHFCDSEMLLTRLAAGTKMVIGSMRYRKYLRHKRLVERVRADSKPTSRGGTTWQRGKLRRIAQARYREAAASKMVTDAFEISAAAQERRRKSYRSSKKGVASRKAYRQSEKALEAKKAYRQSEKAKAYRQSEKALEAKKAYRQSEKALEAKKAYNQSEKAKAYRQSEKALEAKKAYNQSEKALEAKKAYNQSEKAKAYRQSEKALEAKKAYRQSEKGKAARKAYKEKKKAEKYVLTARPSS